MCISKQIIGCLVLTLTLTPSIKAAMKPNDTSVIYLNCDAQCDNIYMAINIFGRGDLMLIGHGQNSWSSVVDENNVSINFLNKCGTDIIIGARLNDIVSLDIKNKKYKTIYTHSSKVFYPVLHGQYLYFSDSSSMVPKASNQSQRRRLFKYDLNENKLHRALYPWVAYSFGIPVITEGDSMYIEIVFPKNENNSVPIDVSEIENKSAYCFKLSTIVDRNYESSDMKAALLFDPASEMEQLRVDVNGNYASGYTYSTNPSSWVIYDLQEKRKLYSIVSTKKNQVCVSQSGKQYIHVDVDGSVLTGTIFDLQSGKQLRQFTLDVSQIGKIVFKRDESCLPE